MGRIIMKEEPEIDYYVEWSSIVDACTFTGTREETLAHLQRDSDPYLREDAPHHPERRLERTDKTGTSSLWVTTNRVIDSRTGKPYPEEGSWLDDSFIYMQLGSLTRAGLFVLCHRQDVDDDADVSDLLTPFEDATSG